MHVIRPLPITYTGMDKTCVYTSFYGFICVSGSPGGTVSRLYRHIRQAAIPARVVLGTAVFYSVPRLRIPVLCDAHARLFRVTSVFTK